MDAQPYHFQQGNRGGPGRPKGVLTARDRKRIIRAMRKQALQGNGHAVLVLQNLGVDFRDALGA